jgi:hypothetical protein
LSGRLLVLAILGSAVALVVAVAPAFANTSTATSTNVTAVQNGDGTVTMTVSGTWNWPGQACNVRYGTAWSIGWWGIGSSATPLPSLTLTNVSLITNSGQGQGGSSPSTGSQTAAGSWKIQSGTYKDKFLYVGSQFNGQQIYTTSFCNAFGTTGDPSGTYSATATYPTANDVPSQICVNTYDIHLDNNGPNGAKASDYDATANGDNSVNKDQFTVAANCAGVTVTIVPAGGSIGGLGLAGLIALGMLVLLGSQAMFRRRRRSDPARG